MKAPLFPRKPLWDLNATELRKLYERAGAYASYQNQRIIELGYGQLRFSELYDYTHVPMIHAYLQFNEMMMQPILDEMRKRQAWHGDEYKPIPKKFRNPF